MMMMWDWWKMLSMIIEQMMREMYYPMMMNYVIVYELLLDDFETIPKKRICFSIIFHVH
jgi:hypothetical protein